MLPCTILLWYLSSLSLEPYLFINAGQGEKGRSLGDLYVLDLSSENYQWKRGFVVDPPNPRHQHTLVGPKLDPTRREKRIRYLFGGINTPDNIMYNDVWIMNYEHMQPDHNDDTINNITFKPVRTTGESPSPRKGHSAFCYNESMFVFGGETREYGENTTNKIYILDLNTSWNWSTIDTSVNKISSRSLFSTSWFDNDTVLFFGGLENDTNKGVNDLIYLDLKNMHFSFPFTAGEYPDSRYGHSTCNYIEGGKESLMLLGGIDDCFCTMDIYSLLELRRVQGQSWEKIIQKTQYEEDVTQKAIKFVYNARTHNLNLKDILIEEKNKGIVIKENEKKIREEYERTTKKWEKRIEHKDKAIEALDEENAMLCQQMENIMELIKHEQYLSQVLEEKGDLLEDNFKNIQDYMTVCDNTVFTLNRSKE